MQVAQWPEPRASQKAKVKIAIVFRARGKEKTRNMLPQPQFARAEAIRQRPF
jgi:hypothetical protein